MSIVNHSEALTGRPIPLKIIQVMSELKTERSQLKTPEKPEGETRAIDRVQKVIRKQLWLGETGRVIKSISVDLCDAHYFVIIRCLWMGRKSMKPCCRH